MFTLFLAIGMSPPTFIVENRCPPTFTVVSNVPLPANPVVKRKLPAFPGLGVALGERRPFVLYVNTPSGDVVANADEYVAKDWNHDATSRIIVYALDARGYWVETVLQPGPWPQQGERIRQTLDVMPPRGAVERPFTPATTVPPVGVLNTPLPGGFGMAPTYTYAQWMGQAGGTNCANGQCNTSTRRR